MAEEILKMSVLKDSLGVCRLESGTSIPDWCVKCDFTSITRTRDELSVVCSQNAIPEGIPCERDWRAMKVDGPLDFSLVGILSSISTILAQRRISVFAISTYDTDYILVKEKDLNNAIDALSSEGYDILSAEGVRS